MHYFVGILRQPSWWNLDAAIDKKISIKERAALRLRAQAFNVFNHTEFNSIGTTYQWNAAGVNLNTTTGQYTGTQPARTLALTARIEFWKRSRRSLRIAISFGTRRGEQVSTDAS